MDYAIVGAGGRQIDPAEYEVDTVIGGLALMDDDAIIGNAGTLMQRYPNILARSATTAPRVNSLLLNASTLRNVGALRNAAAAFRPGSGPQVVPSQPGPVGLAAIPFNSVGAIAAGASATIVVQPQSIFKPYKLVIDDVIRPFFLISSFNVGTTPLFDAPGLMAGTLFTPDALPNLKKITANPGIAVTMTITNRDGAAHPFYGAVYGEAAPTACG